MQHIYIADYFLLMLTLEDLSWERHRNLDLAQYHNFNSSLQLWSDGNVLLQLNIFTKRMLVFFTSPNLHQCTNS